jgi:hypothetical protein
MTINAQAVTALLIRHQQDYVGAILLHNLTLPSTAHNQERIATMT